MNKSLESRLARLETASAVASGATGVMLIFANENETDDQAIARHIAEKPDEAGRLPIFVRFISPAPKVLAS